MVPALSNDSFLALSGMISVFNECKDVLVDRDDAVVKISGTRSAVENSSRAIRAVVSRESIRKDRWGILYLCG